MSFFLDIHAKATASANCIYLWKHKKFGFFVYFLAIWKIFFKFPPQEWFNSRKWDKCDVRIDSDALRALAHTCARHITYPPHRCRCPRNSFASTSASSFFGEQSSVNFSSSPMEDCNQGRNDSIKTVQRLDRRFWRHRHVVSTWQQGRDSFRSTNTLCKCICGTSLCQSEKQ